jgi:adenine-specific DNA-methyltransferase
MEQITANHPLSKSADIIKQNVDILKSLFPTIVKEGKIDVEELKALLGEEIESSEEYYRFTWAGKSQARQEANKPSTGTLRPIKEESKDWDTTQNIFIEGDNLEVLKLLQKSYASKIKMIYIDPPYNTGEDFVYKDNYADNLGNYLSITGQSDEEGRKLNTNTESDGRFHSNWLNMMYPRLKLGRNLLQGDGVIFISIDDNEFHNLRKIGDEIFGEENFVACFIWEKRTNRENRKMVSHRHDYLVCYCKDSTLKENVINMLPMSDEAIERYKNPDNDPRGPWKSDPATAQAGHGTKNQFYVLTAPNGKKHHLQSGRCWLYTEDVMQKAIDDNRIWFGKDGNGVPRVKTYLDSKERGLTPESIWFASDASTNENAKKDLKHLFDGIAVFETPKPVELIKIALKLGAKTGIVLDFFSGSGVTAEAVMKLNLEDGEHRKFICVQIQEATDIESEAFKAGYKTIADITKERIRRAGKKIKSEIKEDLFKSRGTTLDIGFRVFKLDSSNINAWDGSVQNFEQNLLSAAENIKPDRTEEDVLYEILLKSGLDLAQPIEEKIIAGMKVFNIGLGALFICLSNDLSTTVAEGIGQWKQELEPSTCRVIFKDTGFNDVEKTNSIQILRHYGINEVNTI